MSEICSNQKTMQTKQNVFLFVHSFFKHVISPVIKTKTPDIIILIKKIK